MAPRTENGNLVLRFSERQLDELFESYSEDRPSVKQLWEFFGQWWDDVLESIRTTRPEFGDLVHQSICRLKLANHWDKIKRLERQIEAYHAVDAVHKSFTA